MHCSVMGMEALQAAISEYRKKKSGICGICKPDGNDKEMIVCRCFGITDSKIRKIAVENGLRTAEQVTDYTKAGGACGQCLDKIQEILDGIRRKDAENSGPEEEKRKTDGYSEQAGS